MTTQSCIARSWILPALMVLTLLPAPFGCSGDPGNTSSPPPGSETPIQPTPTPPPPTPPPFAPPLEGTIAYNLAQATSFLYTGANPIQTGVAEGTINPVRVAVLRGKVRDSQGPLDGVTITVLSHPEYGVTITHDGGQFDMAVNGGGRLVVKYELPGYLSVQRSVQTPWQDFAWVPDVFMTLLDAAATPVELTASSVATLAVASIQEDKEGKRQAAVLFPAGTLAEIEYSDDSGIPPQPIERITVRATEYTVGNDGPAAMPGVLPASSGYTYAVELSADEVSDSSASLNFTQNKVFSYVRNFLEFPVGTIVPAGYYDRNRGIWIPSENGMIIAVVRVQDGFAELDIDGDEAQTNSDTDQFEALGITDDERRLLGTQVTQGDPEVWSIPLGETLGMWRVPVTHFTPWDYNYPNGPPADASSPGQNLPSDQHTPKPGNCGDGSIIEYQNQVLGESLPIVGTPLTLNYRSDRVPGRSEAYSIDIPLTSETYPASLKRIDLLIDVAGQHEEVQYLLPSEDGSCVSGRCLKTNIFQPFTWNGLDAYGRKVQGSQPVTTRIGYVYDSVYYQPAEFAKSFAVAGTAPITKSKQRGEITIWQDWKGTVGTWDASVNGLGGWSLNIHHAYDPVAKTLYMGNGEKREAEALGTTIDTYSGGGYGFSGDGGPVSEANLFQPNAISHTSDGSIYISDSENMRVRKVNADGIISTVAGNGQQSIDNNGDGGPATEAGISWPTSTVVMPDGTMYIAEEGFSRIRKVGPDGIISTISGNGYGGFGGDGQDAINAQLGGPVSLALDQSLNLYISDSRNNRIRVIRQDGIINTFAGNGLAASGGDGGQATEASLNRPMYIAFDSYDNLYIAEKNGNRVRRVTPTGIITTVAGNGTDGSSGDGGPATLASISGPTGIALSRRGELFVAQYAKIRSVREDGTIFTIAGDGHFGQNGDGDGGLANQASFNYVMGLDVDPSGNLYAAMWVDNLVSEVQSPFAGFSGNAHFVQDESGAVGYSFDEYGRHLETRNTLTNSPIYSFGYDSKGRLATVSFWTGPSGVELPPDGSNSGLTELRTTIDHSSDGKSITITGPYGQKSTLTLDANGYLASVSNPQGETVGLEHDPEGFGLLLSMTDPAGMLTPDNSDYVHTFTYAADATDKSGRLFTDDGPAGSSTQLARDLSETGYTVTADIASSQSSPLTSTYEVGFSGDGTELRSNTFPDKTFVQESLQGGQQNRTYPDGTVVSSTLGPDPRFGMLAPIPTKTVITIASAKLTRTETANRSATMNTSDPTVLATLTSTYQLNDHPTANALYDAVAKTITTTTAARRKTLVTLDALGRVSDVQIIGTLQSGTLPPVTPAPIHFEYDSDGRVSMLRHGAEGDALARVTQQTYYHEQSNQNGYPHDSIDAENQTTSATWYDNGQLKAGESPGDMTGTTVETAFKYDANGNMTFLTPPGQPSHEFRHTQANQLEHYIPPPPSPGNSENFTTDYQYTSDHRLELETLPDGSTIDPVYNGEGQIDHVSITDTADGTHDIGFGYNDAGQVQSLQVDSLAATSPSTVSFVYTGSMLTQQTWAGDVNGNVLYTPNNDFLPANESVNGSNMVKYIYDHDLLLDFVDDKSDLDLTHDANSGLLTGSKQGEVEDIIGYSPFLEVASYRATVSGAAAFSVSYDERDNVGRILQKTESILDPVTLQTETIVWNYTYYPSGRLWTVNRDGTVYAAYTYDDNGNRQSYSGTEHPTVSEGQVLYDDQDRLSQYGGTSYQFDDNGALETRTDSDGTTHYTYDALGNLRTAILKAGTKDETSITYAIDGANRRVGKRKGDQWVQKFLYGNGLGPVAELDGSDTVVSRFVYATHVNVPDYMVSIKDGKTYHLITDHLGSPRLVIDVASGAIVLRLDYDEFGNIINEWYAMGYDASFQPFGFAGGLYDRDTGLVRFGARDYDPQVGRWTAKDPIGFGGGGTNHYAYGEGDSVNLFDPLGLDTYAPEFSFNFSGLGLGFAASVALVSDDNGDMGILFTPAAGASSGWKGGLSVGYQTTTASSIDALTGWSSQLGLSYNAVLIPGAVGYDFIAGAGYTGHKGNLGVALGTPFEIHAIEGKSYLPLKFRNPALRLLDWYFGDAKLIYPAKLWNDAQCGR